MRSREEVFELCGRTLEMAAGFEAELIFEAGEKALTRFASNVIHQNMQQYTESLTLRILKDGRTGRASTDRFDDRSLAAMLQTAREAWAADAGCGETPPLPGPQEYKSVEAYSLRTAELTPEMRAETVSRAVARCRAAGLEAAGIFSNDSQQVAVANSRGLFAWHPATLAKFSLTAADTDSSGWASTSNVDAAALEIDSSIEKAVHTALESRNPQSLEPGEYTLVLPPEAVGDFMYFLAWRAFNGLAFASGRSPLSGRIGQKFMGDNISIRDDAYHTLHTGMPFDFEGLPRRRVSLMENGIAKAVVHDSRSAAMCDAVSSGHALPMPNVWGPIPLHLVLDAGNCSLADMIADTEKGLLVTHFHYTNLVDPMRISITGMTRDGVFIIENGKIVGAARNMRFTESAFRMLSNVDMLGGELRLVGGGFGTGAVLPAMRVRNFTFTSGTEF